LPDFNRMLKNGKCVVFQPLFSLPDMKHYHSAEKNPTGALLEGSQKTIGVFGQPEQADSLPGA